MTQEQREKFNFIAGRLEGIAYGVGNKNIYDGIMKCSEEIDEILAKDRSRPTFAPYSETKTITDIMHCCKTCKHESIQPDEIPCNDCWYGNGCNIDINYWEAKSDATQGTYQAE